MSSQSHCYSVTNKYTMNNTEILRKTLIDRVKESKVRDPAAFARLQVSELDKAAQHSEAKRKQCQDEIDRDVEELRNIDDQIQRLKVRYDPLCEHLREMKAKRKHLQHTLETCTNEERKVMTTVKDKIQSRMVHDYKLNRSNASLELELARGFGVSPDTTFKQTYK